MKPSEGSPHTRVDLFRHPDKKGTFLPKQSDPDQNIELPKEGLEQAHFRAVEFAKEFKQAADGTVIWALTSNAPRTQIAREIFDSELRLAAQELGDEAIVMDMAGEMPTARVKELVAKAVQANGRKKKIVLINGPVHPALGIQKYDDPAYIALSKKLGGEQNMVGQWQHDPMVSKRIGVEYDHVAEGFAKMADEVEHISTEIFPDRNVWLPAFGHSFEVEVALATWSGTTTESVVQAGGEQIIGTMQSGRLEIMPDGQRHVTYNGQALS